MVILLAATAASAAVSTIIVQAGIAPAFAGAVMVINNIGRRPQHSAAAVAAVSSATLHRCIGRHRNRRRNAVLH